MADDYGYINARIKMMRGALLEDRHLDEAVGAATYSEYLRVLSETSIREDLGDATAQGAGLNELDAALSQNLFRVVRKVQGLASGQAKKEIDVLIARWDLLNIKTLVRGVITGRSSQDILAGLIPAGTIKWGVLQAAANSTDLAGLAQTLSIGSGFLGRTLRQAVSAGATELLDIEVALDQDYFKTALAAARENSLRRYLAREVDIRNILTALQLRGGNLSARYFVPGGSLNEGDFMRIAGGDSTVSDPDLQRLLEAGSLDRAETLSRGLLDRISRNVSMSDVLGPGVALDFLRRKEVEIARLRLIGRGKFYGVPADNIRQELGNA
ncbi:V-type ATPase subunit [Deinococcus cellulosilyticus]|uniref:V-type ATP synthase subunit C n=1 Tax=Deinococcus cellulosilyticus (strain DSM 18568 / NBRC 106333 / KACC 11606 / 5516J-15) TaxID=1223518 RepID=A0A511MZ42_DEIC1|nr:V-type ATPase subunit [Deinococcus cellulosilyticus]GEM45863.1 v-type ATP synthase subunit C [Deinococcus cellulosilyticus NBRC 106333 = KACC 11606]